MKALVTGGAGFIGRWTVKYLLKEKYDVYVLDNLSNGEEKNIAEFKQHPYFKGFVRGDILQRDLLRVIFEEENFDICFHLASTISVQESLDNPLETFKVNIKGTFNMLEEARRKNSKIVFISTCMVYKKGNLKPIDENYPISPLSPYAASKLSAENLILSYYYAYNLPVVILRPFNTYGPYQKGNSEGGVISIFIKQNLKREALNIYGEGTQTRDFLYVEDCANFIVKAGLSDKTTGKIINAGTGKDISINELAKLIAHDGDCIHHIPHIHPQSEISKLCCDYSRAESLLGWKPKTSLRKGIAKTREWIRKQL